MEKVEKRKMDRERHEEVKLIHEIKQEVGSRDEAVHIEQSNQ